MSLCVQGGEGGWQGGFVYASYREKGRPEGERVQNPELSCVITHLINYVINYLHNYSSKTPHANICKYES